MSKIPIQVSIPTTEEKSSMLKSYTVYCVEIQDFGRTSTIERRFDDFQKLHHDLSGLERLPPLPEKKMFASTDFQVVSERRPAFEKLLRFCIQSEDILFEDGESIWKFLELPAHAMITARYLFKRQRLAYAKECALLMDEKVSKIHAFRLCHDSVIRVNLLLLNHQEFLSRADTLTMTSVIEMLRYSIAHGTAASRSCFLEEDGIATMMRLLLRLAQQDDKVQPPDQRIRNVMNALIHAEGENYPRIFAKFLNTNGVSVLAEFNSLCKHHIAFSEFIGRALWVSWEIDSQRAFLKDISTASEALGILSALFSSESKCARIMAGLLISSLIARGLFASSHDHEAKAAAGLTSLLDDLVRMFPAHSGFRQPFKPSKSESESAQAVEALIGTLGRTDRSFSRIVLSAAAPFDDEERTVAAEDSALWSASAFALWCLVKIQSKAERIANLRPVIPILAQHGPQMVRWLSDD